MQRDEKRHRPEAGAEQAAPVLSAPQTEQPAPAAAPTGEQAAAVNNPKQTWVLNLDQVRSLLPMRPQDALPELDNIFHFLATTPENNRPLLAGTHHVNDNVDLKLECHAIVRRDQYNRIKIDLFSAENAYATSGKATLYTVTTVNCIDLADKKFHVKAASKYLAKEFKICAAKHALNVDAYAASYDIKDDPTQITRLMTTETNNMKEIGFNKVKGPFIKVSTGAAAGIHCFFTMKKIPGTELFDRINQGHFKTFDKMIEISLRCVHATDKQVWQFGKFHLDIKPENFIAQDYATVPVRTRVKLIDGETLHDANAAYTTRKLGTHGYSAPELTKSKKIEPSSDAHALGMLSRVLSHDVNAQYFLCGYDTAAIMKEMDDEINTNGHIRSHYRLPNNIDPQVMRAFSDWHYHTTLAAPELRYSNTMCREKIEEVFTLYRLSQFAGEAHAAKRAAVSSGLAQGFKFAKLCRETGTKKLGMRSDELRRFINELLEISNALANEQGDVSEFIWVLDDLVLFGCDSYEAISDHINGIYDGLKTALLSWNALALDIQQCANYDELKVEYELFYNTIKNTPLSLDAINDLAQHVTNKELKMRAKFLPLEPMDENEYSDMDFEMEANDNQAPAKVDHHASTDFEAPTKRPKL